MSRFDYLQGREIASMDPSFYALIQAAMRKADSRNSALLQAAWPEVWGELQARFWAPQGLIPEDGPPYLAMLAEMNRPVPLDGRPAPDFSPPQ